jgi:hypothetical protein
MMTDEMDCAASKCDSMSPEGPPPMIATCVRIL